MLLLIGILAVTAVIITINVPPLLKEKKIKELVVFLSLLGSGVMISILLTLNMKVANPFDFIQWILTPVIILMQRI